MTRIKNRNNSDGLNLLTGKVKELRLRLYSYGVSEKIFVETMKQIFAQVCGKKKNAFIKN